MARSIEQRLVKAMVGADRPSVLDTDAYKLAMAQAGAPLRPETFYLTFRRMTQGPWYNPFDLDEFFRAPRDAFRKGDLMVEVRVPLEASRFSGSFLKSGRKRLDVAIVNCAVALDVEGGVIREARIALGGVDSVPVRAREAEGLLAGRPVAEAGFEDAARAAAEPLEPRSDHRASAGYRKKLAAVLARRALVRAAGASR